MEEMIFASGNEALAYACLDFGIDVATGYPGTPSTEILETLAKISPIDTSWSPNEKVALEVGMGASFIGGRAVVTMKHVGLNVAADPLMNLSYTGVGGALVIVSCDDPGIFSSQNEQDNRNYAKFAKIPMMEPSDTQESYDFFREAIHLSERFDTPVLYRMTTRVCHSKSSFCRQTKAKLPPFPIRFKRDEEKYLMMPKQGRKRHRFVEERLEKLEIYNDTSPLNRHEKQDGEKLVVTSGVSYHYVKELGRDDSIYKLGLTYPLPVRTLRRLVGEYSNIRCIEELDPFLEENLLIHGIPVEKKRRSFYLGEYTPERVEALLLERPDPLETRSTLTASESHPPALCSGCPHFTIFNIFRNLDLNVSGDIGCYTIGALEPFRALHSVVEMGASIPMATGMRKLLKGKDKKKTVAVIGDSTFFHSGLTGLLNAVQHNDSGMICILDNGATAMTGRQGHPGTGKNLTGKDGRAVDYVELLKAIGVERITVLDPYRFRHSAEVVKKAVEDDSLHVLILKRQCALLNKRDTGPKVQVQDNCVKCGDCLQVGCPSISFSGKLDHPVIDLETCTGCGICEQVCDHEAILPLREKERK